LAVIFEHVPRDTFMHRMNPLAKVIMVCCIFAVMSFYWDLQYLTIIFILVITLYLDSRAPKKWLLLAVPIGGYRFIEASIMAVLQPAEVFRVIPPELAGKVLFSAGPLTMYYGGFLLAWGWIYKIFIGMALTFTFIYSTSLNDLIKSLRGLHIPTKITYIVVVALRFVPELFREIQLTFTAQSLKGWKLKTKNPKRLIKMAAPIAGPFTRRIVGYVDRISLTTQIRAFGGGEVKYYRKIGFKPSDWIVIAFSLIAAAYAVYILIVHSVGLI